MIMGLACCDGAVDGNGARVRSSAPEALRPGLGMVTVTGAQAGRWDLPGWWLLVAYCSGGNGASETRRA